MKAAPCLLLGLEVRSAAIPRDAARVAFPESVVTTFNTLEEALKCEPGSGFELLVLASHGEADVFRASEATEASGLRRWGSRFCSAL